ncbi:hypothetical protein BUALT_Bualt19G0054200 [Buddleja alternifolia]|uniref:SAC3/GANP/THP3 conserved domain-containing protein n=1 Tax=Buddleja alternifolia TaxID=168488 RepID=A0AAV6W9U6_9LAMI|nr:hypothetical protein BUALT_Bualt19G0054200 [Buddleja alternifolia]
MSDVRSSMADRSRQPRKPRNRRNYYYSSSSSSSSSSSLSYSNSAKPSNPTTISNTSSSRINHTTTTIISDNNDDDTTNQDFPPTLLGTCPFMCPVEERARRERLRDLAVFERLHGNPAKTSPTLAVKKFCRTISSKDMQAFDVRPVSVLQDTLNYLLNLLHSSDRPFEVVHDFIFDRTRSIRQDLSMQNTSGDQVIHMYERMIKFHIVSQHHLRQSCGNPNTASLCHLNLEQLIKALTTLFNLYEVNRASNSVCHNEAEFCSFYLLLHLGSDKQGESLLLWFRRIPSLIMKSKEMCFARRILRYHRLGYYKNFIYTTEEEASYLQYCILEPYINEVRILALSCVSYGGYKLQPYPLAHLSKLLMMKESDVESLCVDCAFETSIDGTGKGLLSTKQSVISKPTRAAQKYYQVDSERIERLSAELSEL